MAAKGDESAAAPRAGGSSGEASRPPARPDLAALRDRVAAITGTARHRLDAPRAGEPSVGGQGAGDPPGGGRGTGEPPAGGPAREPSSGPAGIEAETLAGDGLTEIHADETRGGGSAAGFVLALAARLGASPRRPLLWIAQGFGLGESGRLYGPGLAAFGFDPGGLVQVETARLDEAVWAAEEAARSGALACAVLEVRGNPGKLGLDGTRRLHVRSRAAGVPLLLLRQGAVPEPTAAPMRLRVRAGPAAPVAGLGPIGERLIGHPIFSVAIEKSRDGRARRLLLEWNPHDRRLQTVEPRPLPGALLPAPADRSPAAGAAREVLAFRRAS